MLLAWPDYLCLALIAWGALGGGWLGFVRVTANLVALVAGLLVGAWATGPVVAWLARAGWVQPVSEWVSSRLPLPAALATAPVGGRVPVAWGEGWPPALKGALQQRADTLFAGTSGPVTVGELIGRAGAELLFSLVVFLTVAVVVQALLRWAGGGVSRWVAGRGLGWPDRLAGAAVGAARNALFVGALAAVAVPLLTFTLLHRNLLRPGGLTWTLAEWFDRIIYPWLMARLY